MKSRLLGVAYAFLLICSFLHNAHAATILPLTYDQGVQLHVGLSVTEAGITQSLFNTSAPIGIDGSATIVTERVLSADVTYNFSMSSSPLIFDTTLAGNPVQLTIDSFTYSSPWDVQSPSITYPWGVSGDPASASNPVSYIYTLSGALTYDGQTSPFSLAPEDFARCAASTPGFCFSGTTFTLQPELFAVSNLSTRTMGANAGQFGELAFLSEFSVSATQLTYSSVVPIPPSPQPTGSSAPD